MNAAGDEMPPRPDPEDPLLRGHWEAARRGELAVQRCAGCGQFQWPPRETCGRCAAAGPGWEAVHGAGTLFTWTVVHHTVIAPPAAPPFAVGIIALRGAPVRMLGRITGIAPGDLEFGLPLEVAFEAGSDGVSLPTWRPLGGGGR